MWQMIAEAGLGCSECRHAIQPGRLCLSDLPEETPYSLARADFRNYCIGCPQCWAQGKHACYVRHLENKGSSDRAPRSLPCAHCGIRIGAGETAAVDFYYEWPGAAEDEDVHNSKSPYRAAGGASAVAVGADALIRGVPSGSFESLSQGLRQKFANAGLGGERGTRSAAEAQDFYHESIPHPLRNLGDEAVRGFVDGKDASHIQSAHNAPHLVADNTNIIWEGSGLNRARGAEGMGSGEYLRAQATNAFDAAGIVFRDCLATAAITALYAGLLEAPVAALENYLHYRRGRRTGEEAIRDAALAIGGRAVTGAAIGFTVTAAVALVGAGPILVTVSPVLLPVGMALYTYNALKRITEAATSDMPLHRVGTYFCSPRCHIRFSWETGCSALMRWEDNRARATE